MLHFYYLMFFPVLLKRPGLGAAILLYNLVKLSAFSSRVYEVDVFSWVSLGGVHKLERLNLLFSQDGYYDQICKSNSLASSTISMTQLLSHTFAHLTGSSFRLKAKLLPIKNILGVKYNWVNSVKKWLSF